MLINIALLLFVFGALKKKRSPYVAALILGAIKAAIYGVFARNLVLALVMGCIFGGLAAASVYFMKRLDRREDSEREEVPSYRSPGSETMKFKWEYIPLVILLLVIISGELLLQ